MNTPRISASSYSNTAPLVWSFLYGRNHGDVELILDNAPARSVELLEQDRVDAALVPVIASQFIDGVRLIPDVCVGARERVRSVCLITDGKELKDVRSVALDVSSRTSVVLTKIIFREFLGFEPEWRDAKPDIDEMLAGSDAALLIGDPALSIADRGSRIADFSDDSELTETAVKTFVNENPRSEIRNPKSYDLAELWHEHTGLGFVFAMWMTRKEYVDIDFAAVRDEGLANLRQIAANYSRDLKLSEEEMHTYLSENISYKIDESMQAGLELYLDLAAHHGLIAERKPLSFI